MKKSATIFFSIIFVLCFNAFSQKDTSKKSCADCHAVLIKQKNIHAAAKESCENCHQSNGNEHPKENVKGFSLGEKLPDLCFTCHEKTQKESMLKNVHPPFADDCANCHNAHSSDEEKLLVTKSPDLCFNCHDMEATLKKSRVVHGAVTEGKGCANCHSPHASDQIRYLIEGEKDLCISCHNKTIKTGGKTISNIGMSLKNGNHIHKVIEVQGCKVCHNPHASDVPSLLKGFFPSGQYTKGISKNFELCFNCHDSGLLEKEFSSIVTNFRNGDKNLHYLHINGEKGRNCNICHNVHGSVNDYLINDKVRFGNWDMPIRFKKEENGGSCSTGCHAEKKYNRQL